MFDVLAIAAFCFGVWGMIFVFIYIMWNDVEWYAGFPALVIGLILYLVLIHNIPDEDFLIDKSYINTEMLELPEHRYEVIFPDTLTVEIIEYDMPASSFWDYETHRIYIDSTRYIEIRISSKYDSSHIEVGKKLFKE